MFGDIFKKSFDLPNMISTSIKLIAVVGVGSRLIILLNSKIPLISISTVKEKNCWGWCHPIITRNLYKIMGTFSLDPISDAFLRGLASKAQIYYKTLNIKIKELHCNEFSKFKIEKPRRCVRHKKKGNAISKKYKEYLNKPSKNNKNITNYEDIINKMNKLVSKIRNQKNYKKLNLEKYNWPNLKYSKNKKFRSFSDY